MAFYPKQCCRHQNARVFRFQPKKEVVPLFVLVVGHILLLRRCCHRDTPFLLQRYYPTSYASQIRILCVSIHKQDLFRVFNQYLLGGVLFHGTAESSWSQQRVSAKIHPGQQSSQETKPSDGVFHASKSHRNKNIFGNCPTYCLEIYTPNNIQTSTSTNRMAPSSHARTQSPQSEYWALLRTTPTLLQHYIPTIQ